MKTDGELVYVALGANLGDREASFEAVLHAFAQDEDLQLLRASAIFETPPVGPPGQGAYLNAVLELRVWLEPAELLRRLHAIERAQGRDRAKEVERWGPRKLDLDILFFGDRIIDSPDLVIPHARAHERNFVMTPLAQIVPELRHPRLGKTAAEISRGLPEIGSTYTGQRPLLERWPSGEGFGDV